MNDRARKRVTGDSLHQYLGQAITLLGELLQLESSGKSFTMKTPSNDIVTVLLQEPVQELLEGIVEIQGTVGPNNRIQCERLVNFSKDFAEKIDMALYNEVVSLARSLPTHYVTMQ